MYKRQGKDYIMHAYEEAVKEKYRFFSFGDAMAIFCLLYTSYIKLENLLLNSYFNKYFSRIETLDDIIAYRKALYNFKEIYGMNSFDNEYNKYYSNKIKDLEDKRIIENRYRVDGFTHSR